MTETSQLVWVKDNAGNLFLCPLDALKDPNSVSEADKKNCLDDASRITGGEPASRPGHLRA